MLPYPQILKTLIDQLKKFPGVGQKSAERYAFQLIEWSEGDLQQFAKVLASLKSELKFCRECGALMKDEECAFCNSEARTQRVLCVVSHFKDIFAIEQTHEYQGIYHVLGGVLSPLEGKGPETLSIEPLKTRIETRGVKELIIALDSTLEGDATSLFIKEQLASFDVVVSRLAFGLPLGSALDYVDGGTLAKAFSGRHGF